ncbi:hypothetical protein CJD36_007535 [Flavipsychrobacter stenotrophus]|uniref:Glycosyltransferase 2-like domain-containing protein n=1 Tax=Flavipsychrobacter stenotrophus TaxID=2077091 RepID=A0A2S7SXI3_9BACT|nr:glycosyltransferase [Flavipsychrobacter stenotrophus]PQJ11639.1 hypothetical protein CJD36_007535 [Flavipsychrobacter stenotrophus]
MVSIIIPTYNRANLIGYTLNSLRQEFHPGISIEILVVDDGSDDGTEDMIRSNYAHVIFLKNRGKGAPAARNTGLHAAKGEYILYLDSDDLIGPGYFKEKITLLEQTDLVNACYGEYDFFRSDNGFSESDIIFKHKYPLIESEFESELHLVNNLGGNYIPPNAIIWKTYLLKKIGGHDESLLINQDVDLLIRAIFNGLQMRGIKDGTKVYIRSHSLDTRVGAIANSTNKLRNMIDLRKRIYADLVKYKFDTPACLLALSTSLFNLWRSTRNVNRQIADEFLQLSKEVYWPVEIKGNIVYRALSKLVGPVKAVELKYSLLKRD